MDSILRDQFIYASATHRTMMQRAVQFQLSNPAPDIVAIIDLIKPLLQTDGPIYMATHDDIDGVHGNLTLRKLSGNVLFVTPTISWTTMLPITLRAIINALLAESDALSVDHVFEELQDGQPCLYITTMAPPDVSIFKRQTALVERRVQHFWNVVQQRSYAAEQCLKQLRRVTRNAVLEVHNQGGNRDEFLVDIASTYAAFGGLDDESRACFLLAYQRLRNTLGF
jgi:hypothetical protein